MKEKAGEYPFTRGIYPEMYRQRLWTARQYSGFTSAEESNQRYKYLLKKGVMGLSVAFDLPTQIGYDSDHILARGEVGKVGVPITSVLDMDILLKDIALDKVTTSMTINSTASILLAFYIISGEKKGISLEKLQGTVQNDILKEYIARGTYIYPPQASLRLVTDIIEFCSSHIPKWNTISISGYHIREAGSTAVQELAFTLANGIAYVESALEKGLKVDEFGPRISFFFNAHNDFFTEIGKFRAARRLWSRIMKERFGATNPKAMMCRFHTQTGGSTLTAQQVQNNVVRTTIQALSAILGGTQSLHTNAFDEALALPTRSSAILALRTQQVIAEESGIINYIDPLGGSEIVEEITDNIVSSAKKLIDEIDKKGGAVKAIESGWIQNEISQSAYAYQKDVDSKKQIIVGLNQYEEKEDTVPPLQEIDQQSIQKQIKRVKDLKQNRDNNLVKQKLEIFKTQCKGSENLMPAIIDCARSDATIGEISDVMRSVFGEHTVS